MKSDPRFTIDTQDLTLDKLFDSLVAGTKIPYPSDAPTRHLYITAIRRIPGSQNSLQVSGVHKTLEGEISPLNFRYYTATSAYIAVELKEPSLNLDNQEYPLSDFQK